MSPPVEATAPDERRKRLLLLAGLWVAIAVTLFALRSVVMPFAGAALIAYLVQPLVARITRLKVTGRYVPRWVAILLIYAGFFLAVYLFFVALVPQLYREVARISREMATFASALTPEHVQGLAQRAEEWLNTYGIPVALSDRAMEGAAAGSSGGFSLALDLEQMLTDTVARVTLLAKENLADIVNVSRHIVTEVLTGVFMLFFILMVAAFFSIDAQAIRRYFGTLVPAEFLPDAKTLVARIDKSLSGVVRGQVTICLVNGGLTLVGLLLFGVKFAFLLATIATLFSLIPIFGTIISSVPIVLIALADGFQKGVALLLWIIGIHALEAYFLNPKIMGEAARIHPVVVAFSLIAGEKLFGLWGALFAVPVASIAVACFDYARLKAQPPPLVATTTQQAVASTDAAPAA
ncbi:MULTISPECIES: AI-2E family transporter [Corallococcus]|uniref:AI-2E family transporter n=1 Tax=Corallococcus TaxID=83461 RepID=UPI000EEE0D9F|nr:MULTISPECIES: AI-2E family transporter [Corallococcus]NPD23267.1 AI-2E family transporter [Corallococcus exiguus]NRD49813.1 AI-2E family transporter [Corallococcus exiguus]RKH98880.1 AI-2E family transporter [Corallococcus sp. AB038B]